MMLMGPRPAATTEVLAEAEVGFHHQLTAQIVLDAGIGTEFAGPADRFPLLLTTGISVGF
jgi:hypothetical protein